MIPNRFITRRCFCQSVVYKRFNLDGITNELNLIVKIPNEEKDFLKSILKEKGVVKKQSGTIKDIRKLVKKKQKIDKSLEIKLSGLDLTKSNRELIEFIKVKSESVNKRRYYDSEVNNWSKDVPENEIQELQAHLKHLPNEETLISGDSISKPLDIGDLVTLSSENLRLFLVVGIPKSFKSNICTLLSDRGEILFLPFQQIVHRLPNIVPQKYHYILEKFIQLEEKLLNIQPAGIPDSTFSKSTNALPNELRAKGSTINEAGFNEQENDSEYEPNNFIVAQAASQLLTNSDVNTYLVPISARKLYVDALTQLSIKSTTAISELKIKLQNLYKTLQYDENGNLNVPRTISIFEILKKLKEKPQHNLTNSICILPEKSINYDEEKFKISDTLALLYLLKTQSKLWTIQSNKNSYTSTKVTIWPLAQSEYESKTVDYLKSDSLDLIAEHIAKKAIGVDVGYNDQYSNVIELLKLFVSGKFDNDDEISTAIVFLLRKVDKYLIENGVKIIDDAYKNEYSRGKAYDLLLKLNSDVVSDPNEWFNTSLNFELQERFYKLIDELYKSDEIEKSKNLEFYQNDPLQHLRVDMREVPIYCIDDESAHEIDDGISIEEQDDKYIVSIHIAEPSAYIKPNSTISSIAFQKASTQYLPDQVFPMLPNVISDISGLGRNKDTKTFVTQYKLNKKQIDEFILNKVKNPEYQAEETLLNDIKNQVETSKSIKYAITNNFRKGFTYNEVNKVLDNNDNYLNDINQDFNNLIKLHNISELFYQTRGSVENFATNQSIKIITCLETFKDNTIKVDSNTILMELKNTNKMISISDISPTSKSTRLVSEQMIMANYLTAKYAFENNIKILYRYLDPKLSKELLEEYQKFINDSKIATLNVNQYEIFKFFSRAAVTHVPQKHFPMNLSMYTNITSPLRRFIDILNQWKFQDHFLNRKLIPDDCLPGIASHINGQNSIMKLIDRNSKLFWQGYLIRNYKNEKESCIDFKIRLKSTPQNGTFVGVKVDRFPFMFGQSEVNDKLLNDIKSGDVKVVLVAFKDHLETDPRTMTTEKKSIEKTESQSTEPEALLKDNKVHVDVKDTHDLNAVGFEYYEHAQDISSEDEELMKKKILRKLDYRIVPLISITYMLQFLDKLSLNYAAAYTFREDLGLSGQRYSLVASIFNVGYLFWAVPGNMIIQKVPVAKYVAFMVFCWSIILFGHVGLTNYAGAMVIRFILGCFEAGISPSCMALNQAFFPIKQQSLRMCIFLAFNGIATILGAVLAYGLGNAPTQSIQTWKLIFLTIGGINCVWSIVFFFFCPSSPVEAKFLTEEEKAVWVKEVAKNNMGLKDSKYKKYQIVEAATDSFVWMLGIVGLCCGIVNGGVSNFASSLITGFGFTSALQMPTGAVELFGVIAGGIIAFKFKNTRLYVMFVFCIPPLAGLISIHVLPLERRWELVVATFFQYMIGGPIIMCWVLSNANISGSTKKTIANGFWFCCYAGGNIIGPNLYKADEAPKYRTGMLGCIASYAVMMFLIICMRVLLQWRNKQKDKLYGEVDDEKAEKALIEGFQGKTDFENEGFRYSL
ncbi:unnamed protein product [Candida verbasci]|uniref:RNB domain-containing protein n=1 Tax=Candida verbasci TaxID=1227364 RepID=A0A9W4TWN5_9ASCO|nr:unnamed protein product [Candida verbasci]